MIFHEICHWITNGMETSRQRDWGFELGGGLDPREHACQRLQASLAERHGLRDMLGPTGEFRQYWDRLPADPLEPLDDSDWEAQVRIHAVKALARAEQAPFAQALREALEATASIRAQTQLFLSNYKTEIQEDELPSLWAPRLNRRKSSRPDESS
jgi:hypothetical protein